MLSVKPELYSLSLFKKEVFIKVESSEHQITPHTLNIRRTEFKSNLIQIHSNNVTYIELILLPVHKEVVYKSAMEVINENIVQFNEEDVVTEDENDNFGDSSQQKFAELLKKIENKKSKNKRRLEKIGKIDWQGRRLPQLARQVNAVFCSEQKSVIKLELIVKKVGTDSGKARSDLQRLVKESNGWLTQWNGWLRRKSSLDINDICKSLV